MPKRPKVLFLSRGNATRSQMAEGFLRGIGGERFEAASAGIEPGVLNPLAVEVMNEAESIFRTKIRRMFKSH